MPCLLGNLLMIENDRYYFNLCSVPWHLMTVSDQKAISLLLVFAHQPRSISMKLNVLNLEMFLRVIKLELMNN